MTLGPCPRCQHELVAGAGVLGEAACAKCHARWLDHAVVEQVRELWLKVAPDLFAEMARAGAASASAPSCPQCRQGLRVQRLRGVEVDLCQGCGGMLLDPGELLTLSRGQVEEARGRVATGGAHGDGGAFGRADAGSLELASRPRAHATGIPRWGVFCVNCEAEIDMSVDNYIINDRPWCEPCVSDAGLVGVRGFVGVVFGALNLLFLRPLAFLAQGLARERPPGLLSSGRGWRRWRGHQRHDDFELGRFAPQASVPDDAVIERVRARDAGEKLARFATRDLR